MYLRISSALLFFISLVTAILVPDEVDSDFPLLSVVDEVVLADTDSFVPVDSVVLLPVVTEWDFPLVSPLVLDDDVELPSDVEVELPWVSEVEVPVVSLVEDPIVFELFDPWFVDLDQLSPPLSE